MFRRLEKGHRGRSSSGGRYGVSTIGYKARSLYEWLSGGLDRFDRYAALKSKAKRLVNASRRNS
jgi:hypothetical protein